MWRSTPAVGPTAIWVVAVALASGCERAPEPDPGSPAASQATRIVSLSPAISRTLVDFGLQDQVVGRSAYCASLDEAIPIVGDLYDVDFERLIRLNPTHVLIQPSASTGLDPALERLAARHGWQLGVWSINTIDQIEQLVGELPGTLYGPQDPRQAEAARHAAGLLNGIAQGLAPYGDPVFSGRTLLVSGTDPVLAFGRQTYLGDILVALGGENATTATGWAELSLEEVIRMDPEAIIIVRDGGPQTETLDPLEAAGPLGMVETTARREGRVAVLRHPDALLPSSGVIGLAGEMKRLLGNLAAGGSGSRQ